MLRIVLYFSIVDINDILSEPFIVATMAVSLFAVIITIVALILLIMLCKQRATNEGSYFLYFFSFLFAFLLFCQCQR